MVFESVGCAWVLNQHLPGLLFAPLPMPVWQKIALLLVLITGVLPLAMLAVRKGNRKAGTKGRGAEGTEGRRDAGTEGRRDGGTRAYTVLAVVVGLWLWVSLLGVHALEAPPPAVARLWVCLALMVPWFVLPAIHRQRLKGGAGRSPQPRRVLYAWWLLLGSFALGELVVGEFVRAKEWRIMIVQDGPYATIVDDARRFHIAPHARWQHRYSSDPDDYFGPDRSVTYRANSRGLRERELPIEKPSGVLRIAALGDSFTLGEGVHVQDTWPRQLERVLRERYPEQTIEVINAGVNAYDTRQELEHYRRNVGDYEPDLVIVAMVWNDVRPGDAEAFGSSFAGSTAALAQYLPLTDRMARTVALFLGHTGVHTSAEDWGDAFGALKELKRETAKRGADLLVAIYPSVRHLANDSLRRVYALQKAFCEQASLPVFDAGPVFASLPPVRWHVHPVDNHPNAAAHRVFAEHLADRIKPVLVPLSARQFRRHRP